MDCVSKSYTVVYELRFATNYKWLNDNSCYNMKTGRTIKQVYKNGCIGYFINQKFYSLTYLRPHLKKPSEDYCPF